MLEALNRAELYRDLAESVTASRQHVVSVTPLSLHRRSWGSSGDRMWTRSCCCSPAACARGPTEY